jgi:hypothetical protein
MTVPYSKFKTRLNNTANIYNMKQSTFYIKLTSNHKNDRPYLGQTQY